MYIEPWMAVGYILLVGFAAVYNFKKGFRSGRVFGKDATLLVLEAQGIIKLKDGEPVKYDSK